VPGVSFDDVVEVSNYIAALEHRLSRLRGAFPLSNRLLQESHERLPAGGRGTDKQPGEFRSSLNWIDSTRRGNAQFAPRPPARSKRWSGSASSARSLAARAREYSPMGDIWTFSMRGWSHCDQTGLRGGFPRSNS